MDASVIAAERLQGGALDSAADALAHGDWARARELFEASLAERESPEAWEGLGWAGYWLHDPELTIGARKRAYRGFRIGGDSGSAGRLAAWLAADFLEFRGDDAVASGWLERGRRLLDEAPPGADHGWLAVVEGSFAANVDGDLERAAAAASRAAGLGREHGVADLEAIGLALEGLTLVARARVSEGMRCLDEASAIATGEELELPISGGWALCYMIAACEGVGDFDRAGQWCEVMRESTERWGARHTRGVCRSTYGRVLATGGDWAAAEIELTGAIEDLKAARPGMAAAGVARLGELRARQGRTEEARALFERAGGHRLAELGLGSLALDAGDAQSAADIAERVLRRLAADSALDRLPALELLVEARTELGDLGAAAAACAELAAIGAAVATPHVEGRSRLASASVALARGADEDARRACEDARDRFGEASDRFEAARARLALARALYALGRERAAAAEAGAAREEFATLGADRELARAEALMTGSGRDDPARELSARELEILGLVADGLSDREIADRLLLSPHTVHRHVANVRVKLRQPSRAAAVAFAARTGLL